jgi:hypothetical protein
MKRKKIIEWGKRFHYLVVPEFSPFTNFIGRVLEFFLLLSDSWGFLLGTSS